MDQSHNDQDRFAALVGLDWADQEHAGALCTAAEGTLEAFKLPQTPDAIEQWAAGLRRRFSGRPVAICLEQSKGALVYALLKYDFIVLFPVNPKQLARFREAMVSSGAKDDPGDAMLLLELLRKHRQQLRAWQPDDVTTRLIGQLAEDRRNLVDYGTRLSNTLKSRLKQYFPLALEVLGELDKELACQFLLRWPTFEELRSAEPAEIAAFYRTWRCYHPRLIEERLETIRQAMPLVNDPAVIESGRRLVQCLARQLLDLLEPLARYDRRLTELMQRHPDAAVFESFPGAGDVMAPRLLAAFGTDRQRFKSAADMQSLSGAAPVTRASGKTRAVLRRWACNKFLLQTFHEFAQHSMGRSAWAKTYYDQARRKGKRHHAAVRALAFKWIRILYRCWQNRTLYNEAFYFQQLQRKGSRLVASISSQT